MKCMKLIHLGRTDGIYRVDRLIIIIYSFGSFHVTEKLALKNCLHFPLYLTRFSLTLHVRFSRIVSVNSLHLYSAMILLFLSNSYSQYLFNYYVKNKWEILLQFIIVIML